MCSCWELTTIESINTEFRTMYKIVLIINYCITNYTQTLWLTTTIFIISVLVGQESKSLLAGSFDSGHSQGCLPGASRTSSCLKTTSKRVLPSSPMSGGFSSLHIIGQNSPFTPHYVGIFLEDFLPRRHSSWKTPTGPLDSWDWANEKTKESKMEITMFCKLILEITSHNFSHYIFIRRKSLIPVYIQMEGITEWYKYQWVGTIGTHFRNCLPQKLQMRKWLSQCLHAPYNFPNFM